MLYLGEFSLVPLWFIPLKPWKMALKKGAWDPKPRVTNVEGTNLKSLINPQWDLHNQNPTWRVRGDLVLITPKSHMITPTISFISPVAKSA